MLIATRFLLFCVAVLALPAVSAAQTPPPLDPGWYRNNGPAIICENCDGVTLKIVWENSYVYEHPPGTDPLYWHAQIKYINTGSQTLDIICDTNPDPSAVRENMSETPNAGYVAAEETFCTRNPGRIVPLKPGEALDDWAIFHNVPWKGGKVSLEDDLYGSSAWVDPWASPYPAGAIPPPSECPPELESLGTCLPVLRQPRGKDSTADNLIVLVHGCCTPANTVRNEWDQLGRKIGARLLEDHPYGTWELVVLDWTKYAGEDQTKFNDAYNSAKDQGAKLAKTIAAYPYKYVHLIGHSAGARLIHFAAADDQIQKAAHPPFIHLTFLDAYTQNKTDDDTFGKLTSPHFSEHYVDIGLLYTDTKLPNAFNFDITAWQPVTTEEKRNFGHQWPRYWYEKSVSIPNFTSFGGYALSLEGSGTDLSNLLYEFALYPQSPLGNCMELVDYDEVRQVCD